VFNSQTTTPEKKLIDALKEIAAKELAEGDAIPDEPTFGARHYIKIARDALDVLGISYEK